MQLFFFNAVSTVFKISDAAKIAFISSDQGGMDIEEVAKNNPEKILTTKIEMNDENMSENESSSEKSYNSAFPQF